MPRSGQGEMKTSWALGPFNQTCPPPAPAHARAPPSHHLLVMMEPYLGCVPLMTSGKLARINDINSMKSLFMRRVTTLSISSSDRKELFLVQTTLAHELMRSQKVPYRLT